MVSHNIKRRHLTKQAVADALVAAEDFNLHYALVGPADEPDAAAAAPEAKSVIKITEPKTASSRKLAEAWPGMVSHVMIAATRKVKQKGEPELQEAVKSGRIGVQDAAKVADRRPRQKAIANVTKTEESGDRGRRRGEERRLTRWRRRGRRQGPTRRRSRGGRGEPARRGGAAQGVGAGDGAAWLMGKGRQPDARMVSRRGLV